MKAKPARMAAWALLLCCGCAGQRDPGPGHAADAPALDGVLQSSFRAHGQAGLDRLQQTPLQQACSRPPGQAPAEPVRQRLQREALDTVVFPDDGRWLGDWRRGEQIAQSGVGLQYNDKPDAPRGGNCYACHRLSGSEIAYGTIGPSLYHYRERAEAEPGAERRTWIRIWNAHAFSACTVMPRFGDGGILTADQIRDVMALLLDPQSPVNR